MGPILVGLEQPVQIASMGASVNQILDMACFAAHGAVMKE
jgi:malate dehydrogenase (oxaloacetate-decarboxylating)(NADP+)